MKRTFLILTAALSALCALPSCQKSASSSPADEQLSGPTGVVRIDIGIPQTKSDNGGLKDYQINSVQVIVFDESGKKETDRFETLASPVQNTTSMTITMKTGVKTVYAILNSPRLTESAQDKMEAHLSDLSEKRICPVASADHTFSSRILAFDSVSVTPAISPETTLPCLSGGATVISATYLPQSVGVKGSLGSSGYVCCPFESL